MKPIDTKPEFPKGIYESIEDPGAFCAFSYNKKENKLKRSEHFWVCREEFLGYSFKGLLQKFLFTHKDKDFAKISAFLEDLQNVLKLSEEDRAQIRPTKNNQLSMVFLSKWWNKNVMRRAFLTIALRAGWHYNLKNPDLRKAMYSNQYFKDTVQATEAFLKGRTVYQKKTKPEDDEGWVDSYGNYNEGLELEQNLQYLVFEK